MSSSQLYASNSVKIFTVDDIGIEEVKVLVSIHLLAV